jgi:transforming growth factor-beta-induced protein
MKLACFGLFLSSMAAAVRGQNLAEVVGNNTDLSTLSTAIQTAGLTDDVSTAELTLFAPNNDAFSVLDPVVLTALMMPEYLYHLRTLLFEHAVEGTILSSNITDGETVDSLSGPLTFSVTDNGVFVSGSAFNNSEVVEADILADNGVVHVVDQVFLPKVLVQNTWQNLQDVPEGFDVLKEYLISTGLDAALEGSDPLTILAPTDEVFAGVSQEELDSLNMTEVLLNHALPGLFPTNLLTDGMSVTTALGNTYTVSVSGESYSIGGVPLVETNYPSLNGVFHVLSGLLLPMEEGEAPVAPPVLAPVASPTEGDAPTVAAEPTDAPSSAAMVGTFMTMAAMIATTLLW